MNESTQTITSTGEAEKPKQKFDTSFLRNIKILAGIGAIALLLVAVVLIRFMGNSGNAKEGAEITSGNANAVPAEGNLSPAMQAKLNERQRQEAVAAAKSGQSYIPPDQTGQMMPIPVAGGASAPMVYQVQPMPPIAAQQGSPVQPVAVKDERRETQMGGLGRQLKNFLDENTDGPVRQTLDAPKANVANSGASQAGANTAFDAAKQGRPIIEGLTIHAARLENALRVDEGGSGFASASIVSGKLAGAYLTGVARVVNGDSLSVTFTNMRYKGHVYPVQARLLDQRTANDAMRGNVDNRLFERWVMPITFAMAEGFFGARAKTGTQTVSLGNAVAGGTTAIVEPAPSRKQAESAGIAKGMEMAGQVVNKGQQTPINVSSNIGVTIGILFENSVYEGSGK